jgi:exopolysaccharide production repressor protein
MSFPLFLRGMLIALAAFAVTTYVVTQSVWTTFIWTVACAVLIQIGYFATVLILIRGAPRPLNGDDNAPESEAIQASAKNDAARRDADRVPGATGSSRL